MPSRRTNNFPESGRGLGHVTPTIFGSTVGYPSDSLASCFKPYWDEEMPGLKRHTYTCDLWVFCGRPSSGPICRDRCGARAAYRHALKYKSQMASSRISNDLNDRLLSKDCVAFWKTWRSKVNDRRTVVSNGDGCSGAVDIANRFATNFHQRCLPNSSERNEKLKQIFDAKFNSYCPESKLYWISLKLVNKTGLYSWVRPLALRVLKLNIYGMRILEFV